MTKQNSWDWGKIGMLIIVLGIILLVIGVFLWQTGLNNQELTTREQKSSFFPEHYEVGQQQEVAGLTMLAIGSIATIGGGLVLIRSRR